jgi:hypothetical protein
LLGLSACRRPDAPRGRIVADPVVKDARSDDVGDIGPTFAFPLHVEAPRAFPPAPTSVTPEPLPWNEKGAGSTPIDTRVQPMGSAGELVRYTLANGWPGPEIVELRRGGTRRAYFANVEEALTSSTGQLVVAQYVVGGGRQLIVVDLATAVATLLPRDECSNQGARWFAGGTRLVTYGRPPTGGETRFCVLDASFAVVARITGDVRWDPHDTAIDVDVGLLPREPGTFYVIDNLRSTLYAIDLNGPRRAWFEFDAGGWYEADLGAFTLDGPTLRARQGDPALTWPIFTGRPVKLRP